MSRVASCEPLSLVGYTSFPKTDSRLVSVQAEEFLGARRSLSAQSPSYRASGDDRSAECGRVKAAASSYLAGYGMLYSVLTSAFPMDAFLPPS